MQNGKEKRTGYFYSRDKGYEGIETRVGSQDENKGYPGKLTTAEQEEIIAWLQEQSAWDLSGLRERLRQEYDVEYKSKLL